ANATEKLEAFNANYEAKSQAYNANHDAKINSYEASVSANLKSLNTATHAKIADIADTTSAKLLEFNENHMQKMKDYNANDTLKSTAYNDTAVAKLQAYNQNHEEKLKDYNANVTAKMNDIDTQIRAKYGDIPKELNKAKDDLSVFKTTLVGQIVTEGNAQASQIAAIKSQMLVIEKRQKDYGFNFATQTFSSNATFTPPIENIYYYVFIQGGTGPTNSPNRGNPTSFGGYVSVAGGLGNVRGIGQMGACASNWVLISTKNPINVVVGSGGVCVISWPQVKAGEAP
ncbi:hypothetical protein, partial [Helicobacter ailurogastricus]